MKRARRQTNTAATPAATPGSGLDPVTLGTATDAELGDLFRKVQTLPLDVLVNTGGHQIDMASRTLFNDEHWKGWLPRGLVLRDIFTRLSTGYAKRFWKQGDRYLGETLYLDGRIRVKHALEGFTLDRPVNDLDPGSYILLRYTDPVFEHLFYDVMKAADDGIIVYGGYSGRFPEGRRGFTSVLMRRYSFAQLGLRDHQQLTRTGTKATADAFAGRWRLDAVTTADHPAHVGMLTVTTGGDGKATMQCDPVATPDVLVPSFVVDHFTAAAGPVLRELRIVDASTIVGTWHTEISSLYAKFVAASPGLLHRDRERGSRSYTMRYLLTREV